MTTTWTEEQRAKAKSREYVRDWKGRFARTGSRRVKRVAKVKKVRPAKPPTELYRGLSIYEEHMNEGLAFRLDEVIKKGYNDDPKLGADLLKFLHLPDPSLYGSDAYYNTGNLGRHWTKKLSVTRRFQEPGNDMYHFTIHALWAGKGKSQFQEGWAGEFEITLDEGTKLLVTQIGVRKRKTRPEVVIELAKPMQALAAGIREVPPEWDKIKGVNAKSDGKKLWAMKKAGKIKDMKEMFSEAGKLERAYKKAHPNADCANRNGIVNGALRHEFDENGHIEQLYWPDDKRKGAAGKAPNVPAKPATPKVAKKAVPKKREIDKTPGGMSMQTGKVVSDPKLTNRIVAKLPKGSTGPDAFVDLEFRKVDNGDFVMQNGEPLRRRWQVFAAGIAINDQIHLVYGGSERELIAEVDKVLGPGGIKVHYTGTRQIDEMILRGRFTNARRAHEGKPFYPHLKNPDRFTWVNMDMSGVTRKSAENDFHSKYAPDLWANGGEDRERVLGHLQADVAWLVDGYKPTKKPSNDALELHKALQELKEGAVSAFSNFNFKDKPTEMEKAHYRALVDAWITPQHDIEQQIAKLKPDLSREIRDCRNYDDLWEVMTLRHPQMFVDNFEPILNKKREELVAAAPSTWDHRTISTIYDTHKMFAATKASFTALDDQMMKYPKIPIRAFKCEHHAGLEEDFTGAVCSRGAYIEISINPKALVDAHRRAGRAYDAARSWPPWHAMNTHRNYFYTNVVHEFGHAVDWKANVWPRDAADGNNKQMIEDNGKIRQTQIIAILFEKYKASTKRKGYPTPDELFTWLLKDQSGRMIDGMPQPHVTGYSWNRDDKGQLIQPISLNEDELLAEAWADVEYNKDMASPVNLALHRLMVRNLKKEKYL